MKLEKTYEGKAKILYSTNDSTKLIQFFKDDVTAFNNLKKDIIIGKGVLNNYISEYLLKSLANHHIKTHFIKRINDREQLIEKLSIIPLEVIVRNIASGSLVKRLGMQEGREFSEPILEFCYKNDTLGDPLLNNYHIHAMNIATKQEIEGLSSIALHINSILKQIFLSINVKLVDFKIEFGKNNYEEIILADEISPDSCRLRDIKSNTVMDKDLFRKDLGDLIAGYTEIAKRLEIKLP